MANTGIGKGRSPTPLRTVSTIRGELQALENQANEIARSSFLAYEFLSSDLLEQINAKKSTINFLTTRIRRRKFYNWLRKKTGLK